VKILMMTNTYRPIVGGLERSVEIFTREYRKRGHQALIVTAQFAETPEQEQEVIRVPAIRNVNKTDYSLPMPLSGTISDALKRFAPQVIHSHHPFLLGGTGLRLAGEMRAPLVFTYHTMFEQYTYVLPGDSAALKQFVVEYAVRYANLCDYVIAPSESVAGILRERGVRSRIASIPTGIYVDQFESGEGKTFRKRLDIPESAFVVGYCGRVSPEKNLGFLSRSVAKFLELRPDAYFLVVGEGVMLDEIRRLFSDRKMASRLRTPGVQRGRSLADSYDAMDVLAFASQSETQGLVLAEAMAAGVPVVAVDAPGVREILRDGENGRLIGREDEEQLVSALQWVYGLSKRRLADLAAEARSTAEASSVQHSVERTLDIYRQVIAEGRRARRGEERTFWTEARRNLESEWRLFQTLAAAAADALAKVAREQSYFQ
jgi:glycosyltransferase involved in cell wall biosynthesis